MSPLTGCRWQSIQGMQQWVASCRQRNVLEQSNLDAVLATRQASRLWLHLHIVGLVALVLSSVAA